jgi:hypothetical protein
MHDQLTPTKNDECDCREYEEGLCWRCSGLIRAAIKTARETEQERRFPIQGGPSIPWTMIAPYEDQAQRNHSQSLERLAERGGLSPFEAVRVLQCRSCSDWNTINKEKELATLEEMRCEFENQTIRDKRDAEWAWWMEQLYDNLDKKPGFYPCVPDTDVMRRWIEAMVAARKVEVTDV